MSSASAAAEIAGGEFLLRESSPASVFTPEDFSEEHRAIAKTTEEFWTSEVEPKLDALQRQEPGVAVALLRKSAQLGLTSVVIPEEYGGMGLDLTSMMIVAEGVAKDGSYAAWHGAQTGIGTLPLLFFGTEEQKRTYLPKLASCESIAAYCLSEAHAGSDALAARTAAVLADDGSHYLLNGQKMWITNGGAADLYTVFAQLDGKLTAFLVERTFEGVRQGAEEKKMGIKGSSTRAIYFDNVRVPAGNLLGEPGRGHVIAFNILNLARLKLGAFTLGGAKQVLAQSISYARERIAFGKPIAEFGLIQHKIAEMAARLYAAESMVYRVEGMVARAAGPVNWSDAGSRRRACKAAEEYAIECSFVKVFASEMLDFVVDEGVQIHGGYGYHQDYAVERAYRDSRVNRIFEGTNEINRLLAAGMLLKRAQRKQLPLVEAVQKLQAQILEPSHPAETLKNSKNVVLLLLGIAYQKFGADLENQQEILAAISDCMMAAFGWESCLVRARKSHSELAKSYTALVEHRAINTIEVTASEAIAACSEGDERRANLAIVRKLLRHEPVDAIALRRALAKRLLAARKYSV
jgi:alkylation response protein AidB-like acyl-CoA dehydrogenase